MECHSYHHSKSNHHQCAILVPMPFSHFAIFPLINCQVRLLDETGLELLHSGVVSVEEMQRNGSMALGTYNFSDLEVPFPAMEFPLPSIPLHPFQYDKSYIPSVIPVERAADGRCLCPVFGTDPYDVKVVCSCVAADWKPVRMTRELL
jgi:hypothetical protein